MLFFLCCCLSMRVHFHLRGACVTLSGICSPESSLVGTAGADCRRDADPWCVPMCPNWPESAASWTIVKPQVSAAEPHLPQGAPWGWGGGPTPSHGDTPAHGCGIHPRTQTRGVCQGENNMHTMGHRPFSASRSEVRSVFRRMCDACRSGRWPEQGVTVDRNILESTLR